MKKGMKLYMKMIAIAGIFILGVFVVQPALAADQEKAVPEAREAQNQPEEVEGSKPSAEMNVGFLSQYVWRGQALSRDSLVIQPELTLGWYGFSLDIWSNLDTNKYDVSTNSGSGRAKVTETDITFAYAHEFGPLAVEGGYIYYALDGAEDSQEFYLSLGLDVLLSPTFTVYREFIAFPNWYLNFGIGHSFELYKNVGLDLGASVSYLISDNNDYYYDPDDPTDGYSGFFDGQFSVGIPITVGKYFTITPTGTLSFPVGGDANDLLKGLNQAAIGKDDATIVYGGVVVTFAF